MAQAANRKEIDNTLFIKTFAGVALLLLSAIGAVTGARSAENIQLSMLIAALPGTSAVALLFSAIRKDRQRLSHHQ